MSAKLLSINIDTFVDSERKHGASIFATVIMYSADFHLFCCCFCIIGKVDRQMAVFIGSRVTLGIMSVSTNMITFCSLEKLTVWFVLKRFHETGKLTQRLGSGA